METISYYCTTLLRYLFVFMSYARMGSSRKRSAKVCQHSPNRHSYIIKNIFLLLLAVLSGVYGYCYNWQNVCFLISIFFLVHKAATSSRTKAKNLTLSDPTSDLVRQYDFPVPLRCRKTSDTGFVAFLRPLSEPVRRFSSCSTDFSQQIMKAVLFLFRYVFLF
jgi:hypothetical protein